MTAAITRGTAVKSPTGTRYAVVNHGRDGMLRLRAMNRRGTPVLYRTETDLADNGWQGMGPNGWEPITRSSDS